MRWPVLPLDRLGLAVLAACTSPCCTSAATRIAAMHGLFVPMNQLSPAPITIPTTTPRKFFETEMSVRDCELDQYGVVNNVVYGSYVERAREELSEFLGVSASTAACTGNAMAVSEQNFKYFTPLKRGDKFVVKVTIQIKGVRIYADQFIETLPDRKMGNGGGGGSGDDGSGKPATVAAIVLDLLGSLLDNQVLASSSQTPATTRDMMLCPVQDHRALAAVACTSPAATRTAAMYGLSALPRTSVPVKKLSSLPDNTNQDAKLRARKFFELEMSVSDCDTDPYGVVNNAVYANYVERVCACSTRGTGCISWSERKHGSVHRQSDENLAESQRGPKFVVKVTLHIKGVRIYAEQFIETLPDRKVIRESQSFWNRRPPSCLNGEYRPTRVFPELSSKLLDFFSPQESSILIESLAQANGSEGRVCAWPVMKARRSVPLSTRRRRRAFVPPSISRLPPLRAHAAATCRKRAPAKGECGRKEERGEAAVARLGRREATSSAAWRNGGAAGIEKGRGMWRRRGAARGDQGR
uniref:Uncharacterized protein n=1 Tax=Oryza meridionalis TaxID=40149 RepID=A0A0E0CPC8_9ORYZ